MSAARKVGQASNNSETILDATAHKQNPQRGVRLSHRQICVKRRHFRRREIEDRDVRRIGRSYERGDRAAVVWRAEDRDASRG